MLGHDTSLLLRWLISSTDRAVAYSLLPHQWCTHCSADVPMECLCSYSAQLAEGPTSVPLPQARVQSAQRVSLLANLAACLQFRGITGFLNHCLHKHQIKYSNEADALVSTAATVVVRRGCRLAP